MANQYQVWQRVGGQGEGGGWLTPLSPGTRSKAVLLPAPAAVRPAANGCARRRPTPLPRRPAARPGTCPPGTARPRLPCLARPAALPAPFRPSQKMPVPAVSGSSPDTGTVGEEGRGASAQPGAPQFEAGQFTITAAHEDLSDLPATVTEKNGARGLCTAPCPALRRCGRGKA